MCRGRAHGPCAKCTCTCVFYESFLFRQQIEKDPKNVKSLLKRIYSLARHPSAFKRLGAALAFNNIYTILR